MEVLVGEMSGVGARCSSDAVVGDGAAGEDCLRLFDLSWS